MEDFYCKNGNCENIAVYGYNIGENIFCKECSLKDMILTFKQEQIELLENYEVKTRQKCYFKDCIKRTCYNFPDEKTPICCKIHCISSIMIDIIHKRCSVENCNIRPTFNYEGEKIAVKCSKHKDINMINVSDKLCTFENCKKSPAFNFPDENRPIRCMTHKIDGMTNIKTKLCIVCLKTQACFNYIGTKTLLYCNTCKKNDMVNIKSQKCNCGKHEALFGYEIDKVPRYCNECKLENMLNLRSKKCKCGFAQPHFNYEGLPAQFCSLCKNNEMINVATKKCLCGTSKPSFNYIGLPAIYCSLCKEKDMIHLHSKRCSTENCEKVARYNFQGLKAIKCIDHKENQMINVLMSQCKNNWCNVQARNKNFKGYCARCFINEYPDQEISKKYKIKERHVTDYITETFPEYPLIFDKQTGGCSKRRPDCYIDLISHVIIVEVDEYQHKYYDTNCEIARINELFTDFNDRPIIFIRFNPDGYINKVKNRKKKSCFKDHETRNILIIRDKNEWKYRLNILKETIEKYIKTVPEETIFEYLFYDTI